MRAPGWPAPIPPLDSARNRLIQLENLSDEELNTLEKEFQKLHERVQRKMQPKEDSKA